MCYLSPQKADAVRVITFTGCMGETHLDSKPIGLWNFREKEGDCKGCTVRLVKMSDLLRSVLCITKFLFYYIMLL